MGRQGRLARDDFGILVYHMDCIVQNWAKKNATLLLPYGTWMNNCLHYLLGMELTVMGPDAPTILTQYCLDLNQVSVGDRSVLGGGAYVVGHVFQHGDMIWDGVIIGADCSCHGLVMSRDKMQEESVLAQMSSPFANAVCRKGHAYAGAMGAETDMVPVDFKGKLSAVQASERTPLLST